MARSFDGASYVIIQDSATLRPVRNITLSCWAYTTSSGGNWQHFLTKAAAATWTPPYCDWLLRLNSTNNVDFLQVGGGGAVSTGTISINTWYHIAGTCDGTTLRIYINGSPDGTAGFANIGPSGFPLYLGCDTSFGETLNGRLADITVWSSCLSPAEIYALAHGYRPFMLTWRRNSLLAYYPFRNQSGVIRDFSGYGNLGVLTGTTFVTDPPLLWERSIPVLNITPPSLPQKLFIEGSIPMSMISAHFSRRMRTIGY